MMRSTVRTPPPPLSRKPELCVRGQRGSFRPHLLPHPLQCAADVMDRTEGRARERQSRRLSLRPRRPAGPASAHSFRDTNGDEMGLTFSALSTQSRHKVAGVFFERNRLLGAFAAKR